MAYSATRRFSPGWRPTTPNFQSGTAREHAIATSCRAKAAIVARDERETGERAACSIWAITFGHALEL